MPFSNARAYDYRIGHLVFVKCPGPGGDWLSASVEDISEEAVPELFVRYTDGDSCWVNLATNKVRVPEPSNKISNEDWDKMKRSFPKQPKGKRKKSKYFKGRHYLSDAKVGDYIQSYWPAPYKNYYTGKVVSRQMVESGMLKVKRSDDTTTWIDPRRWKTVVAGHRDGGVAMSQEAADVFLEVG